MDLADRYTDRAGLVIIQHLQIMCLRDLKTNLCMTGCGCSWSLRARQRQQISHFTVETLKSHSSKASFIFFSSRAHGENNSWEISKIPFVRSLFFVLWRPYYYSCHLFGAVTFCHISCLERGKLCLMSARLEDALSSSWCSLPVYFQENPTVENFLASWSLLDH